VFYEVLNVAGVNSVVIFANVLVTNGGKDFKGNPKK
jgi:hypothetical protein